MLEIGLGNYVDGTGYSRNMWKEYLINAEVFVMDLDYEFNDEIGNVIKGDQSNLDDIRRVSNLCGSLDFIIDDGSHHPEHQLKTFEEFFIKNLKNGGIYIIEDIECSYWRPTSKVYGYETGYLNIVDFFSKRLHQINSEFSLVNNEYNISTITFGKNCIIIKKQTDEELSLNNREYRFKNML
jgi:demethylmacrocin O-methyltransferase